MAAGATQGETAGRAGRFSHAWRALKHRNFKLFVSGQSISLIGTWMTRLATSWLVYRLTGSALLLGVVGFSGQIFTFLLAPFAGVWVERLDRRKLLVWTQTLAALQSLTLAGLTLARIVTIHEIIALAALQGLINAFDMPGRQAFLVQMVENKQDLGNAIALNSSIVNLARLVGPALAGLVIAWIGEGYCFLIDGISYVAVIVSLLMMQVKPLDVRRATASMLTQMKEGWSFVSTFKPIRTILLLFAVVSLMGMPFMVLLPIFAGDAVIRRLGGLSAVVLSLCAVARANDAADKPAAVAVEARIRHNDAAVQRALQDELARSMSELHLGDESRPYYLGYTLSDDPSRRR